jgi:hypothetical protein
MGGFETSLAPEIFYSWSLKHNFQGLIVRRLDSAIQGRARASPPYFQRTKIALFVQANVTVKCNTILTSKPRRCPFCLEISMFLKTFGQKRSLHVAIRYGMTGKFISPLLNISGGNFKMPFSLSKSAPGSRCPPPNLLMLPPPLALEKW